jgi:hypothetical protein
MGKGADADADADGDGDGELSTSALQSTNTKWRECSQAKATTAGDWSYRQTALEVCNDLLLAQGRNSPIVAST